MSVIDLRFYDGDDPNGALLGTLTDVECTAISLRVALRGIGAGSFSISRSHPSADAALIRKGNYVRVVIPSIQAEPVWGFWLWEGKFNLLDASGDDTLTFSGPGPLGILRDAMLRFEFYAPTQLWRGSSPGFEGLWWWINEPYGAILTRIIEEGQNQPGTPLDPVTIDFDRDLDSDGNAWPNIDIEYQQPIQANILKVFEDLRDAGDLFVVSDPDFAVQAFQDFGTDRTSATFAAGKVRLTDANILTGLPVHIHATNEGTHLHGRDKDGFYFTEVIPGFSGRARYLAIDVPETNDPATLTKIGQETLRASTGNTNAFELEVTPGDDEATGRYLPWLHYNVGDTATVDVATGLYAYADEDAQIVAFRVELDEAADDSTDDTAHRSLHTVLEFNAATSEGSPIEGRAAGGPGCRCLRLCQPSRQWNLPIEFLIEQRWENVHDGAEREFNVRYRNGVDEPRMRVIWTYDLATTSLTLQVQGTDQDSNDTTFGLTTEVMTPVDDVAFLTRFRIETNEIMAKVWPVGDAEPGAWQVTIGDGGFSLTALGVSRINRLEDLLTSQVPDPVTFWQDTLTIVSGFGASEVSDNFSTAVISGSWGNSQFNGNEWEIEGSVNAGVSGGEAFWTAAGTEDFVNTSLIIPGEDGDCPEPIALVCAAGTSHDVARCDHVHTADAAEVSYSGTAAGDTVKEGLDSLAVAVASAGDLVYVATPADTAINSITDVTIVTRAITGLVAGQQLIVDVVGTIVNNSTLARVYNVSLDFDGQFPAEIITANLSTSATLFHPFHLRAVLDIRSTSLAYAVVELDMNPATGFADDANMTVTTTSLIGKVWGSVAADLTGSTTVAFLIRSANATATQTMRLHSLTIRKVTPT